MSATPTYELPARAVRMRETPLRLAPRNDGSLVFTPIGYRDGIPSILGSHAEAGPTKGRFVRVRVVVENLDRTTRFFESAPQRLIAADGREFAPEDSAMQVKRQPLRIAVGSGVRLEFDLWFDLPRDADPAELRLYGDPPLNGARFRLP